MLTTSDDVRESGPKKSAAGRQQMPGVLMLVGLAVLAAAPLAGLCCECELWLSLCDQGPMSTHDSCRTVPHCHAMGYGVFQHVGVWHNCHNTLLNLSLG